jgi:hypothetical protein
MKTIIYKKEEDLTKTFTKSKEEKEALKKAKKEHKEYLKSKNG